MNSENRSQSIYIFYGIAGLGKSTVAKRSPKNERTAQINTLGVSFFFSSDEDNRKNSGMVIL